MVAFSSPANSPRGVISRGAAASFESFRPSSACTGAQGESIVNTEAASNSGNRILSFKAALPDYDLSEYRWPTGANRHC
jgi:hypothetical protein